MYLQRDMIVGDTWSIGYVCQEGGKRRRFGCLGRRFLVFLEAFAATQGHERDKYENQDGNWSHDTSFLSDCKISSVQHPVPFSICVPSSPCDSYILVTGRHDTPETIIIFPVDRFQGERIDIDPLAVIPLSHSHILNLDQFDSKRKNLVGEANILESTSAGDMRWIR